MDNKITFALCFGNRGFFPEHLISKARQELSIAVKKAGFSYLMAPENMTRYGAVESTIEGQKYAAFLQENKHQYDGVIFCLPNFGDETGAIAALAEADVPIFILAYPDEIDKMDFGSRRDAFCGKFSVMDVFYQYQLPFTNWSPHVIHPESKTFTNQLLDFAAVCRIYKGMRKMTIGAIGARTTAFKTVRFDELTLQKHNITTEVLDLSDVFQRIRSVDVRTSRFKERKQHLSAYTDFSKVPGEIFNNHVKTSLVLDDVIQEYQMDALAFRCWIEIEKELNIAPCTLLGDLNDRGIPAACELDVANALTMKALQLATDSPATCLDWNNNWGEHENKCILFHCGPVPQSLMQEKGQVIDHPMFAKALGPGCGWGPNVGRIKSGEMTYASSKTEDGNIVVYVDEGEFTNDIIPENFFGCAGVVEIENLQQKLNIIGNNGFRHHVSISMGHKAKAMREVFFNYFKYEELNLEK